MELALHFRSLVITVHGVFPIFSCLAIFPAATACHTDFVDYLGDSFPSLM